MKVTVTQEDGIADLGFEITYAVNSNPGPGIIPPSFFSPTRYPEAEGLNIFV